MKKKSYKITFSLTEGYAPDGKLHKIGAAEKLIKAWMSERMKDEYPIVSGLLQQGTLFFPSKDDRNGLITASPTAIFTGELSSPEELKRPNKEIKQTLESLAKKLNEELKQEAVFIVYPKKNWCLRPQVTPGSTICFFSRRSFVRLRHSWVHGLPYHY